MSTQTKDPNMNKVNLKYTYEGPLDPEKKIRKTISKRREEELNRKYQLKTSTTQREKLIFDPKQRTLKKYNPNKNDPIEILSEEENPGMFPSQEVSEEFVKRDLIDLVHPSYIEVIETFKKFRDRIVEINNDNLIGIIEKIDKYPCKGFIGFFPKDSTEDRKKRFFKLCSTVYTTDPNNPTESIKEIQETVDTLIRKEKTEFKITEEANSKGFSIAIPYQAMLTYKYYSGNEETIPTSVKLIVLKLFEIIQGRSLQELISNDRTLLTPKIMTNLSERVASFLKYMHSSKIYHGNLQGSNIIIDGDMKNGMFSLKFTNFYFPRWFSKNPPLGKQHIHDFKTFGDVYSLCYSTQLSFSESLPNPDEHIVVVKNPDRIYALSVMYGSYFVYLAKIILLGLYENEIMNSDILVETVYKGFQNNLVELIRVLVENESSMISRNIQTPETVNPKSFFYYIRSKILEEDHIRDELLYYVVTHAFFFNSNNLMTKENYALYD